MRRSPRGRLDSFVFSAILFKLSRASRISFNLLQIRRYPPSPNKRPTPRRGSPQSSPASVRRSTVWSTIGCVESPRTTGEIWLNCDTKRRITTSTRDQCGSSRAGAKQTRVNNGFGRIGSSAPRKLVQTPRQDQIRHQRLHSMEFKPCECIISDYGFAYQRSM